MKSPAEDSNYQNENQNSDDILTSHINDAPQSKNGFSLEKWRARKSEISQASRKVTTAEIRKPKNDEFVMVSNDPDHTEPWELIELESSEELYLVTPDVSHEIKKLHREEGKRIIPVKSVYLYLAVNRAGVAFIWEGQYLHG